ncbi:YfaZ family outer membrane protein, partial [Klebsiella pneumoniae]|nr:porin [Klebsiella pneumoniae]
GVAFPVGGGVNVALTDSIHVFGEGYVAPDGLNNSVKNYVEANGGVSWSPIGPVTLKVGYRHVSVDGKEGRPNHTLIDGAYVGGGVTF